MSDKFIIYGLQDPGNLEIRYIGKSSTGLATPRRHFAPSTWKKYTNSHLYNWMQKCIKENARPQIKTIYICQNNEEVLQKEKELIEQYRKQGARLLNIRPGGEISGPLCTETKLKMSLAKQGTRPSLQNEIAKQRSREIQSRALIDQNNQIYQSLAEAAKTISTFKTDIIAHLQHKKYLNHIKQHILTYYDRNKSLQENLDTRKIILEERKVLLESRINKSRLVGTKNMSKKIERWHSILDQNNKEYASINHAAREINAWPQAIYRQLDGKRLNVFGFIFRYKEDYK